MTSPPATLPPVSATEPRRVWRTWGSERGLPAWLLSLALHAALLFVLAFSMRFAPRGAAIEPDRSVGIALVRDDSGQREYYDQTGEADWQSPADPRAASRDSALPSADESPVDLASVLPSTAPSVGPGGSSSLPAAGQMIAGGSVNRSGGGAAQTKVFGVVGEGTRFVYVFDRSGSMDGFGGRPLASAQSELLGSLDDLDRIHQFQIIFYNEEPRIFSPDRGTPRLVWADQASKDKARRFVQGIRADGGTRHMAALRLALGMRPDVIFFLTDADEPRLSVEELASVRRLNRGTSIHTIEFGFGPQSSRGNFLTRLAEENGGQHAYVDVSGLRNRR
jgi:hypothetical protein